MINLLGFKETVCMSWFQATFRPTHSNNIVFSVHLVHHCYADRPPLGLRIASNSLTSGFCWKIQGKVKYQPGKTSSNVILKIEEFDSVFKEKLHQINIVCSTNKAAIKLQACLRCTADLKKLFQCIISELLRIYSKIPIMVTY